MDRKTHAHSYNTWAQSKPGSDKQGALPSRNPVEGLWGKWRGMQVVCPLRQQGYVTGSLMNQTLVWYF